MTARLHHVVYMVLLGIFCLYHSLSVEMGTKLSCDSQALLNKKEGEHMRILLKNQKGFIFIDALVGMVIFTVALMALAVAYRQVTITTMTARNYNNAVYLAQAAVEELKKNDGQTIFDNTLINPKIIINNLEFTIIPTILSSSTTLLRKVEVSVSWSNNTNSPPVTLVSYYYLKP